MKHHIDPKVDCVFKAILGAEENRNLLIHFLNAILAKELTAPITWVDILNPYNPKEFISDKLSIVDVKAKDAQQQMYQIEIQMVSSTHLTNRIVYNWADIYSQQLKSGDDYELLKPTYSIWLLAENLFKQDAKYFHAYKLRDKQGEVLNRHGGIWILELEKFSSRDIENEEQRWLKFFKEGEQLDDLALPDWMNTPEMRQAMNTVTVFSDKEREYFQYQARQEYVRVQRSLQKEMEKLLQENQAMAHQALEAERKALAIEKKVLETEQKALDFEQKALTAEEQRLAEEEQRIAAETQRQQALLEIEQLKALLNKSS